MSKSADRQITQPAVDGQDAPGAGARIQWPAIVRRLSPWLLLAVFLVWGWRGQDFVRSVPAYGDILEFTWALTRYDGALRQGGNPLIASNAFYPGGWNLATYATGFVFLPLLLPLHRLGGAAFAYNTAVLLSFVVAFAGSYVLARRRLGGHAVGGALFAVLMAFWGLRWFQTIGHLNILWGTALLPWAIWCLERAVQASRRLSVAWFGFAGVVWAATMAGSLYFAWIGGLLIAGWLLGRCWSGSLSWRWGTIGLLISAGVALLLCSPVVIATWRASAAIGAQFYPLQEISFWSASLNGFVAPYVFHPWLSGLATSIYRGLTYEHGAANFGIAASIAAAVGAWASRKERAWRPALVVAGCGLILSLGVVLKWNDVPVQAASLRPLNDLLWRAGHLLKPDVFASSPSAPFDAAVPMPGFLLMLVLPFFERARVFARYAFVASVGVYLLAALAVTRARRGWLRWFLAAVLVFEVIPPPLERQPYPPSSHPAFDWLARQQIPGEGVLDLVAAHPYTVVPVNRGESVWATLLHRQPVVAGASSVWPAYASFLFDWLAQRPHALADRQTVPLLRFYKARYLLLHMVGEREQQIVEEARYNPELRLSQCFPPPVTPSAWPEPICVLEILPPISPTVNLVPEDGWSAQEEWGVWAVGPESRGLWVATGRRPYQLTLEAFPNCVPGRTQALSVEVDGRVLAEHTWVNCDSWAASITIPESSVRLGGNEVVLRPAYAVAPVAGDTRPLSVGFARLQIQ